MSAATARGPSVQPQEDQQQQEQTGDVEGHDAGQQRADHAAPSVFDILGAPKQLSAEAQKAAQSMHHGDSFGQYMALKVTKLREQYESNFLHTSAQSDLFKGISIIVNGYTQPSQQELKQIMLLHGGRFENYMYRDQVTHMICSNLPDTKLKQIAKERNPLPVVQPEWIVASLKAGRVLPIKDFQLLPKPDVPGQRKLLAHKQYDAPLPAAEQLYPQLQQQQHEMETTGLQQQTGMPQPQQQQQLQQQVGTPQQQPHGLTFVSPQTVADAQVALHAHTVPRPQPEIPADHQQQRPAGVVLAVHNPGPEQQQPPGHQAGDTTPDMQQAASPLPSHPAATAGPVPSGNKDADMRAAQELCAQLRAACDVLKGAPKSSDANPNFMEDFFRSSRLHFIGTWKARIEALMAEHDGAGPRPQQPTAKGIASFWQPAAGSSSAAPKTTTERVYLHIDMDCFFASVAAAAYPILLGKPLVVSHSASAQGRGEVSAASYEARAYGICAAMAIGEAKQLCPDLLVVPYMFDKYQAISEQVYHILLQYSSCVQPLSCDEAYLDVTGLGDPEQLAAALRADIHNTTGCPASVGIGPNLLVARLATKKAKPNGQYRVHPQQVMEFLADLPVDSLPGVGWSLNTKLQDMGITRVRQLRGVSKEQLQRQLGSKTGATLWGYAHGKDERVVEPPKARKSVGAEVNWGIRFTGPEDVTKFLAELSQEVVQRLKAAGVRGKTLTLKVKRRQAGAPPPWKMLGHGPCDNLSRSVTLGAFTDSASDIAAECGHLMAALNIPPEDIRGVGISVTKLSTDSSAQAAHPTTTAPAKLPARSPRPYDRDRIGAWPSLHELTEEQSVHAARVHKKTSPNAVAQPADAELHCVSPSLQWRTGVGGVLVNTGEGAASAMEKGPVPNGDHPPVQAAHIASDVDMTAPPAAAAAAAAGAFHPAVKKRLFDGVFASGAPSGANAVDDGGMPPAKRAAVAGTSTFSLPSHLQASHAQPHSSSGLAAALARLHAAAAAAAGREPEASGVTSTAATQPVAQLTLGKAAQEVADADMLDVQASSDEDEEEQEQQDGMGEEGEGQDGGGGDGGEEGGGEHSGLQAKQPEPEVVGPCSDAVLNRHGSQEVSWYDQGSRTGFEVAPGMQAHQHQAQAQLQQPQQLQARNGAAMNFAQLAARVQAKDVTQVGQAGQAAQQREDAAVHMPSKTDVAAAGAADEGYPRSRAPAAATLSNDGALHAAKQLRQPELLRPPEPEQHNENIHHVRRALQQGIAREDPVAAAVSKHALQPAQLPVAGPSGQAQKKNVAAPAPLPRPAAVPLPPASCIDPAVLAELPDDVRQELLAVYGSDLAGSRVGRTQALQHAPSRPANIRGASKRGARRPTPTHSGASSGSLGPGPATSGATSMLAARGQAGHSYFSRGGINASNAVAGTKAQQHKPPLQQQQHRQQDSAVFVRPEGVPEVGNLDEQGQKRGREAGMALPLTMSQVDPAVLAELPEDVRQEVLASLRQEQQRQRRRQQPPVLDPHIAARGVQPPGSGSHKQPNSSIPAGGSRLIAAAGVSGVSLSHGDVQQDDALMQPAGVAAAAAGNADHGSDQFEVEPVSAILHAFKSMVDQLMAACSSPGDVTVRAEANMGAAQPAETLAVQSGSHGASEQADEALHPSGVQGETAGQHEGGVLGGKTTAALRTRDNTPHHPQVTERHADDTDRDAVAAEMHPPLPVAVHQRLATGCEYLGKWVSDHNWDLEAQGAVLAMLCQLKARWPAFVPYSTPCEEAIQQQAVTRYGVVLRPASLFV